MPTQKPLVARAIELAKTGYIRSTRDLRAALKKEGYTNREISDHFAGRSLRQQINTLCKKINAI